MFHNKQKSGTSNIKIGSLLIKQQNWQAREQGLYYDRAPIPGVKETRK